MKNYEIVYRNDDAGGDAGGAAAPVVDMAPTGGDTALSVSGEQGSPSTPAPVAPATPSGPSLFTESLPAEWREQTVQALGIEDQGVRDKYLSTLSRYPSFDKFANAFFEQKDLISKGQHKQGLQPDATPEQLAEYRAANGIPATAEEYSYTLEEGLVLGESDERIMSGVAAVAHSHNISPAILSDMTSAMLKGRVAEEEAILNQHGIDQTTCKRQIKQAWGADHDTNLNVIRGMASTLPDSIRDGFLNAQLADGKMLFNSPEFMVWMADVARQLNPSATVVPNSSNPSQAINDEIKRIEDTMRNDSDAYYRDQAMQDRYRQLLGAQEKMTATS